MLLFNVFLSVYLLCERYIRHTHRVLIDEKSKKATQSTYHWITIDWYDRLCIGNCKIWFIDEQITIQYDINGNLVYCWQTYLIQKIN